MTHWYVLKCIYGIYFCLTEWTFHCQKFTCLASISHRCLFPKVSPYCPACGDLEDNDHFVLCSHPTRQHLHLSLLTNLRSRLDKIPTDPILSSILLEGVNSLLTSQPFPLHLFPPSYHQLCTSQSNIGWINLLRGFISTEWSTLQHHYLHRHNPSQCGKPGILSSFQLLWDEIHRFWQFRNDQRHSIDATTHDNELSRQTIIEITDLYQYQHRVLPDDRLLFRPSLADHLQESQSHLRAWLRNHASTIRHSHQEASASNLGNTLPLNHYFST